MELITQYASFSATSLCPQLGIEISNLDLTKAFTDKIAAELYEALLHNHLIVIRAQTLCENALIKASKIFGEPVASIVPKYRLPEYPLISRHSNIRNEDDEPSGAMAPEFFWHSDSYLTETPNKATILYSIISPHVGGETNFVNMCVAYDSLDDETKNLINNRKAFYKNAYINRPPVAHPLVRINPVTNQKALFVNIHRALGVEGLLPNDASNLLNKLYNHAIEPSQVYQHKWKDGDLVIWYNPSTMHAATPISREHHRLLHRILIKGDIPVQ